MPEKQFKSQNSHWPVSALSLSSMGVSILLPLFLVRILSKEEVGNFKQFFLYLEVVPLLFLSGGIFSGISYWAGQGGKVKRIALSQSYVMILLLSTLCLIIGILFEKQLSHSLNLPEMSTLLFCFAMVTALTGSVFEEVAIGNNKLWLSGIFYAAFEVGRTLAMLFSALIFQNVTAIILAHCIVTYGKLCTGIVLSIKKKWLLLRFDKEILKRIVYYALPVSGATLASLIVERADQFILANTLSAEEFAVYMVGCFSIPPLFLLENSITRVLIPQLSESFATKKFYQAQHYYQNTVGQLSFFLIPSVIGLITFADPLITILFTQEYSEAAPYLRIFALQYAVLMIPFDAHARAAGDSRWIFKTFLLCSGISLLLVLILTTLFGNYGALTGILIGKIGLRIMTIKNIRHNYQWSLFQIIPLNKVMLYGIISIFCAIVSTLSRPFFTADAYWLIIMGTFSWIFYGIVVYLLELRQLIKRARSVKKVLQLTQTVDIGGIEKTILYHATYLANKTEWEPVVFAYTQNNTASQATLVGTFKERGVTLIYQKKFKRFSPLVVLRVLKILFEQEILLIHTHDIGGLLYASLAKVLTFGAIKIIHSQHSFIHLDTTPKYRHYEKFFSRFPSKISVVSQHLIDYYEELNISTKEITIIQNGIEFLSSRALTHDKRIIKRESLKRFLPEECSQENFLKKKWILYLSRIHEAKGHEHALKLWSLTSSSFRDEWRLLFVGPETSPGLQNKLLEKSRTLGTNSSVFFTGPTVYAHKWYESSDIFLSCSEYEGMPIAPLEAVGNGIPSVLSEIPGHSIFKDHCFFLSLTSIDDQSALQFEHYCRKNYQDQTHFWDASRILREKYGVKTMTEQYQALYNSIFNKI